MEPVICDTNVFIRLFAGDSVVEAELLKIGHANVLLPTVAAMELYAGMGNKREMAQITKKLKYYNVLHINELASQKALELFMQFRLSHGLKIPDALIGGMAIAYDLELFTYNQKDFRFMPGIRLRPLP